MIKMRRKTMIVYYNKRPLQIRDDGLRPVIAPLRTSGMMDLGYDQFQYVSREDHRMRSIEHQLVIIND